MPQIGGTQLNTLTTTLKGLSDTSADGLWIFNTDINCLQHWNAADKEWISLCADIRPTDSKVTNGSVTTFTNVMYDFQKQTLEAYTVSGSNTNHQWQVSKESETGFTNIPGANSAFYTIPANFATNLNGGSAKTDSLFFRCLMDNSNVWVKTKALNILFIRTNSGYGGAGTATDPYYLTIKKGKNGDNNGATTTGTMQIALLNLGASGGGDAGDLGDFYQWGRIADGHQHTVWSKDASHVNQIIPMTGGGNTSAAISKTDVGTVAYTTPPTDPTCGQIPNPHTGYGYFITGSNDWGSGKDGVNNPAANARWGDGSTYTSRTSDIPLSSWSYPANNPCPLGWGVPSRWNIWDIYSGTGSNTPSSSNYRGTVNGWYWRSSVNNAIGGAIIINASGEHVFLPAAGYRNNSGGALSNTGSRG